MITVELINTGSELLLGRTLNTHAHWLARRLSDAGYSVSRQTTVADTGEAITAAVREALARVDVVLTTGGLGPTSDDLTRDRVADLLGRKLTEDAETLARIARFFEQRKRVMPASTRVQAMVPEGATILRNDFGTAPGLGFVLESNPYRANAGRSVLAMLPGPPRELRPMFDQQLLPWLEGVMGRKEVWACRTLRTVGIGESMVEDKVAPELADFFAKGGEIGYCAHVGQVDVRLSATGVGSTELVDAACAVVKEHLGVAIFGEGDELLEGAVIRLLRSRGARVATAESCTGGLLSHRLTNVPGSSEGFCGGVVAYSNAMKSSVLGVAPELVLSEGAVSEAVAAAMAEGVRRLSGADYGVALTGIAGPSGGTPEKPVGTVFIAVAGPVGTRVVGRLNAYERATFKEVSATMALDLLRRALD